MYNYYNKCAYRYLKLILRELDNFIKFLDEEYVLINLIPNSSYKLINIISKKQSKLEKINFYFYKINKIRKNLKISDSINILNKKIKFKLIVLSKTNLKNQNLLKKKISYNNYSNCFLNRNSKNNFNLYKVSFLNNISLFV